METVPAVLPNTDTRNQANRDGSIYSVIQRSFGKLLTGDNGVPANFFTYDSNFSFDSNMLDFYKNLKPAYQPSNYYEPKYPPSAVVIKFEKSVQ